MPGPVVQNGPVFDPTLPILVGTPSTGRPINVVAYDDSIAGDFVRRGGTQQVTVDGRDMQLKPGSGYRIVLHSAPVMLAQGVADGDGDVSALVQIPGDIEPSYHVLHVYGTDTGGSPVDIQKTIYVSDGVDAEFQTVDNAGSDTGTGNSAAAPADSAENRPAPIQNSVSPAVAIGGGTVPRPAYNRR